MINRNVNSTNNRNVNFKRRYEAILTLLSLNDKRLADLLVVNMIKCPEEKKEEYLRYVVEEILELDFSLDFSIIIYSLAFAISFEEAKMKCIGKVTINQKEESRRPVLENFTLT